MLGFLKHSFIILLAVFLTVWMSVFPVQASTMQVNMTKMSESMKMSSKLDGLSHCPACPKTADGKSMPGCLDSACAAFVAILNAPIEQFGLVFSPIHRFDQTITPDGAGSEPGRYPPRTTHIG